MPNGKQARPKVNSRLYSPYLGRFVSPDSLLNSEGGPLDYNPYIYARNNPYKYIDRNGEFWWIVAAAVFGGFGNVCANIDNISNAGGFFKSFGIGAGAGALGGWLGPYAAAGFGFGTTGFISGAFTGAITGFTSSVTEGLLNWAISGTKFSFTNCLMQTAFSAAIGGIMGGIDAVCHKKSFWHGYEKGPTVYFETGHPDVKQSTGANCSCACGQSVTDGIITQDQLRQVNNIVREIKGKKALDPEIDGTEDLGTYKVAAKVIGKKAKYVNYSSRKMFKRMMMGEDFGITYDVAGLNRAGEYSIGGHNVLMKRMLGPTWRKPNGSLVIRRPSNMWVMNPALGGVHEITEDQLQSIIRVYK